jgi:hypothetical protein
MQYIYICLSSQIESNLGTIGVQTHFHVHAMGYTVHVEDKHYPKHVSTARTAMGVIQPIKGLIRGFQIDPMSLENILVVQRNLNFAPQVT